MKKIITLVLVLCMNISFVFAQTLGDATAAPVVAASGDTVLPSVGDSAGTEAGTEAGGTAGDNTLGQRINDGTVTLNDLPLVVLGWINLVMRFLGTIAVLMLVWGGFLFMLSGVTEQKEEAKNTIKWAIVGVITASLAWVIVNTIQVFLTS